MKLSISSIDCAWIASPACLRVSSADAVRLNYSTLAGTTHRKVVGVDAASLSVQILLSNRTGKQWLEVASLDAGVALELFQSPAGWVQDAEDQKKFLRTQDAATGRLEEILGSTHLNSRVHRSGHPCLFLPKLGPPSLFSTQNRHVENSRQSRRSSEQNSRSFHRNEVVQEQSDEEYFISEAARDERLA